MNYGKLALKKIERLKLKKTSSVPSAETEETDFSLDPIESGEYYRKGFVFTTTAAGTVEIRLNYELTGGVAVIELDGMTVRVTSPSDGGAAHAVCRNVAKGEHSLYITITGHPFTLGAMTVTVIGCMGADDGFAQTFAQGDDFIVVAANVLTYYTVEDGSARALASFGGVLGARVIDAADRKMAAVVTAYGTYILDFTDDPAKPESTFVWEGLASLGGVLDKTAGGTSGGISGDMSGGTLGGISGGGRALTLFSGGRTVGCFTAGADGAVHYFGELSVPIDNPFAAATQEGVLLGGESGGYVLAARLLPHAFAAASLGVAVKSNEE